MFVHLLHINVCGGDWGVYTHAITCLRAHALLKLAEWRAMLHHNSKTKLLSFHASAKLTYETR